MFNPISTYRLQFNKDFTLKDFSDNLEYFSLLGVSSIYASPVFSAVPGSTHGYDVSDPLTINPEIGDINDLIQILEWREKNKVGWLQDIVPNHMAFHNKNAWIMDVLEKGMGSEYAEFFDIDLNHPDFSGKLMVPFIGKEPSEAIRDKEILLKWQDNAFQISYYDFNLPCSFEGYSQLLSGIDYLPPGILFLLNNAGRLRDNGLLKKECSGLFTSDQLFRSKIKALIDSVNNDSARLDRLLEKQHYKLCFWRDSSNKLNYRRFFTINSLICLATENEKTFKTTHGLIFKLLKDRLIDGLRIDHIDGLKKPLLYLQELKLLTGNAYTISEKILGHDEELVYGLLAQGTSGYDYLAIVNNLFTHKKNYESLRKFYSEITGITGNIEDLIYRSKKLILTSSMNGEWDNLTRLFYESGLASNTEDTKTIREAIGELLLSFPVYKIYPEYNSLSENEEFFLDVAFDHAVARVPSIKQSLSIIRDVFKIENFSRNEAARAFILRFMQFTGPLMAKGVEDTVMYNYNCFIAHNEVGDHSGSDGITPDGYHSLMIRRQKNIPLSLNATSTHDTKRGEDVRARLNVISEMPGEWISVVKSWITLNNELRINLNGKDVPDRNEEYFIYQTLTGAFPDNGVVDETFLLRMDEYIVKSLREAKVNSDWNSPDEEYENSVKKFVRKILAKDSQFLKSFIPFHKKIARYGIINSLSQLTLKATSPGVPDFYQGSELWDLSLVDPDNRRPVDYAARHKMLSEMIASAKSDAGGLTEFLKSEMSDGRIKLWLTYILMDMRRREPGLFKNGAYIPLQVSGKRSENVISYARVHDGSWLIVIIPLFVSQLASARSVRSKGSWKNTAIILPDMAPQNLTRCLTGEKFTHNGEILLSDLMKSPFPVILKGVRYKPQRSSGVLLHVSSLPGNYGIGDLGDEAYKFADVLNYNGQEYWQILPFNPVDQGYAWSPYSSASAFAGNIMFISPDRLVKAGLLDRRSAVTARMRDSSKADFAGALKIRMELFNESFSSFFALNRPYMHDSFVKFCENEKYWLDDYSLFSILKKEYASLPWHKWPPELKNRDAKALKGISQRYDTDIKKIKFCQYLFQEQWQELKNYCNGLGIKIIGDLSFYVNYDSADVWSHPEYFKLGLDKVPEQVAGVPPDYFSETGQLWNMPVYDWDEMKHDRFTWWIRRIKRNLDLCDMVRFDHFRGFSEYWEVPFGEKTAINGKWTKAPGEELFAVIKDVFPEMPFIAEDLGTIDDKVVKLRDGSGLPGMSIIQFAFGENTPTSDYIPHNNTRNSVIYTGTHDNNTVKGWYKNELSRKLKAEADLYAGHKIKPDTCHVDFIKMAYGSVSRIAIIPAQDLLGLDSDARLNRPSTSGNNWQWRLTREQLEKLFSPDIRKLASLYGRI